MEPNQSRCRFPFQQELTAVVRCAELCELDAGWLDRGLFTGSQLRDLRRAGSLDRRLSDNPASLQTCLALR